MFGWLRALIGGSVLAMALLLSLLIPAPGAGVSSPVNDQGRSSITAVNRYYGALAMSRADGAVGWSYDYRTKSKAGKAALRECKQASDTPWSCRKIVWVRNGCVAIAVRWNDNGSIARYRWALGMKKSTAYRKALNKCGYKCVRRVYTCTTR